MLIYKISYFKYFLIHSSLEYGIRKRNWNFLDFYLSFLTNIIQVKGMIRLMLIV